MVENGFVYAVNKGLEKKRIKEEKQVNKKEKAYDTIKHIQNKYNFSFGLMEKSDSLRMTNKERSEYYKAIKLTTDYNDTFLSHLGLC